MTYPRNIEKEILANLPNKRALFILGPRRTGKTTVLKRIREKIQNEKSLYFDLEKHDTLELFNQGIDRFIQHIDDQGFSKTERIIVFIDEIQYLNEFSNFTKLCVDHHSDRIKLILSGSSTAQLKYQFRDSLVGRKFIYRLFPLSFREFIVFKNENRISELLGENQKECQIEVLNRSFKNKTAKLYEEYLIFGGFPEVVLTESKPEKSIILEEMIQAYVLKDVRNLFTIEKIDEFNHLLKLLAFQSGQLLNKANACIETKLNMDTLNRYIQILSDSFLIRLVKPLFTNKQKELKKMPKVYFVDTGIRNMLINNFQSLSTRFDKGELLENGVYTSLHKTAGTLDEIFFWRTKDGKEIDFILQKGIEYFPYEVKIKRTAINHLQFFSKLYSCPELNLVRFENDGSYVKMQPDVNVIPAWIL